MSDGRAIEQTAAFWLMRRHEPDWTEGEQQQLEDWLQEAIAHKAAFWRLEHGYARLDRLSALGSINTAPASASASELGGAKWRSVLQGSRHPVFRPMLLAASIALIFVTGHLVAYEPQALEIAQHSTKFGQTGRLSLADGSQIELNTATELRIAQSQSQRTLWLDRGEAYFEVAHDEKRPFVVHSGLSDITVLGTKFSVLREGKRVTISVVDGRVRVTSTRRSDGGMTILTPGEIAECDDASTRVQYNAEQIRSQLAWRQGMIVFDNTSLADAAAQFNRYNKRRLVIVGAAAANLKIGGSFRLGNVEGFARLLGRAYGLRATVSEDEIKISSG